MKTAFKKEYPIHCDADTEEAILMADIRDAMERRQAAENERRQKVERLIQLMEEDPNTPGPHGFLLSPDHEAHWYTNVRSMCADEWDMLSEQYPEAYKALNGDERRSKPFLVVTPRKKKK